MKDGCTFKYEQPDFRGRPRERHVNFVVNADAFRDMPGFAWLIIAGNPHLSANDIHNFLVSCGEQHWRSKSWISRHRFLFTDPKKPNRSGPKRNLDGKDETALRLIAENTKQSSRQLAWMLKEIGIKRSAEWVRRNRHYY